MRLRTHIPVPRTAPREPPKPPPPPSHGNPRKTHRNPRKTRRNPRKTRPQPTGPRLDRPLFPHSWMPARARQNCRRADVAAIMRWALRFDYTQCRKTARTERRLGKNKIWSPARRSNIHRFPEAPPVRTCNQRPTRFRDALFRLAGWEPVVEVVPTRGTQAKPPAPRGESDTWPTVGQVVWPARTFATGR